MEKEKANESDLSGEKLIECLWGETPFEENSTASNSRVSTETKPTGPGVFDFQYFLFLFTYTDFFRYFYSCFHKVNNF